METRTSNSTLAARWRPAAFCGSSWDCKMLARLVATSFAIPPSELKSRSRRSAAAAFARQVAMYLAHVSLGANYSAVGRAFGRDRTTVAHACRVVEARRDDPRLDALLERLERACLIPCGPAGDRADGR